MTDRYLDPPIMMHYMYIHNYSDNCRHNDSALCNYYIIIIKHLQSVGHEFGCQVMIHFLQSPLSSCVVSKASTSYTPACITVTVTLQLPWRYINLGTLRLSKYVALGRI